VFSPRSIAVLMREKLIHSTAIRSKWSLFQSERRRRIMINIVMTSGILVCYSVFGILACPQYPPENKEQAQEKQFDTSCFAGEKPKPEVRIRLGLLSGKTLKMPSPTYPVEAKNKGISGEVKAQVVINLNTGLIEWAKTETGDPLLQEAVSKVLCQARFSPTNDVDGRASGYLIYRFRSTRKSTNGRSRFQ